MNEVAERPGDRRRDRADQEVDAVAEHQLLRLAEPYARLAFGVLADDDDLAPGNRAPEGIEAKVDGVRDFDPETREHPRVWKQRAHLDGLGSASRRNQTG